MRASSTVTASVISMALVGFAMFGTISFVPLFVQGVIGTSATSSGVVLTPLMLGAVATSFLSGQWVSRSGRYKPNALVGPPVLAAGLLLLWRMDVHTTNAEAARNMVITGIGLGLMMQVFVLSVQNSVPSQHIGSATALAQFARSIGSTLGVTIMGVIVNQGLPSSVRANQESIHRLPAHARAALSNALHPAFLAAASVCVIVFLLVVFGVKEVPLRKGFDETTSGVALDAGGGAEPAAATRR
jgi:MFS family permease